MIDFTPCEVNNFKGYGGANGNKINIFYEGKSYMLKFPPLPSQNDKIDLSYINGCISEYLGCHIYESLGFKTQETILGKYTDKKGKEKIVVACRDFTVDGKQLMEFAQLKNTIIDSEQNGYGTELSSIIDTIEEQKIMPVNDVKDFFWDMFIADALLGNFDRHNGNWGFLIDANMKKAEIAPVYDCGSCLYPKLDEEKMKVILNSENEMNARIFVFPRSIIRENNEKISYFDYISALKNTDCNAALKRIHEKIDINKINEIIDSISILSLIQKDFYKIMIAERKNKIIDFSYEKLMAKENI